MILKLLSFLHVLLFATSVVGHPVGNSDKDKLDVRYSLPDLLKVDTVPANWIGADATLLKEGRIVLTPSKGSKGSLWAKKTYSLEESFTFEWTFRSVNFLGKSKGGLAFWFITAGQVNDRALYNGPSKFDGLQLLVDNTGPLSSSIRGHLNDGTDQLSKVDIYDKTFASCLMGYQDSSVPTTARLTYDRKDNLLKLQVDNRVCFQTRKVKLPRGNYNIGVTADNADNVESFEILKMNMYNGVIEDSLIPNVIGMSQPKMLTKVIDKDTGTEKLVEKSAFDAKTEKISNYDLYRKLDKVEGKVLANDIHGLETQLLAVMKVQEEIIKHVTHLTQLLNNQALAQNSKSNTNMDSDNYKDFISLNEKLGLALDEQEKIRETSRNQIHSGPQIDEIVRRLAIWLMPLVFIMMVMAYYTFKIRQDIIKTKYL